MTNQEFDSIWGKALTGGESVDEAAQRWKEGQASSGGASAGNQAANMAAKRAAAPPGQAQAPEPTPGPSPPGADLLGAPDRREQVNRKVQGLLAKKPAPVGLEQ